MAGNRRVEGRRMASGSLFARNAMRVDAEYDGGNSEIDDDDDSEGDLSQSPAKLEHVNSRCGVCDARASPARSARPCWRLHPAACARPCSGACVWPSSTTSVVHAERKRCCVRAR